MNWKPIAFGVGIAAVGYSLYKYFKLQADLLKNYEYKIVGVKPMKINLTELTVQLTIRFTSKSDIEATVQKIYFDIFAEGQNVGYVTEVKSFVLPAKGSSDIPIIISINPKKVLGNVVNVVLTGAKQKDLNFALDGYADIKSGFLKVTIPIKYQDKISAYF